jgi:hypothetical protein
VESKSREKAEEMIPFSVEGIRRKLCKNNQLSHHLICSLFFLSQNNLSIPKKNLVEMEGKYIISSTFSHFCWENNIFSPNFHNIFFWTQVSYFSPEKKRECQRKSHFFSWKQVSYVCTASKRRKVWENSIFLLMVPFIFPQ